MKGNVLLDSLTHLSQVAFAPLLSSPQMPIGTQQSSAGFVPSNQTGQACRQGFLASLSSAVVKVDTSPLFVPEAPEGGTEPLLPIQTHISSAPSDVRSLQLALESRRNGEYLLLPGNSIHCTASHLHEPIRKERKKLYKPNVTTGEVLKQSMPILHHRIPKVVTALIDAF